MADDKRHGSDEEAGDRKRSLRPNVHFRSIPIAAQGPRVDDAALPVTPAKHTTPRQQEIERIRALEEEDELLPGEEPVLSEPEPEEPSRMFVHPLDREIPEVTVHTVSQQTDEREPTSTTSEEDEDDDEEDATLEELRAQARIRSTRMAHHTIDYWRQMRRYLHQMGHKRTADSQHVEEAVPQYVRLGPKTQRDWDFLVAVRENDVYRMSCALQTGANPYVTTDDGACAIHVATEANAVDTLTAFLRLGKLSLNVTDCRGFSPLHCAVDANNWRMTYVLILEGADLHLEDAFGKTALHLAVLRGNVRIVKMLLYYGANPNAFDCFGETPLSMAFTVTPYPDVARALLNAGGTVDVFSRCGTHLLTDSVLHCSSRRRLDAIRVLVDSGVNLNCQEAVSGLTALHFAAMTDNITAARVLLKGGADTTITSYSGETPLETALVHRAFGAQCELKFAGAHLSSVDEYSAQGSGVSFSIMHRGSTQQKTSFLVTASTSNWGARQSSLAGARPASKAEGSDVFLLLADRRQEKRRRGVSGQSASLNPTTNIRIKLATGRTRRRSFGDAYMAIPLYRRLSDESKKPSSIMEISSSIEQQTEKLRDTSIADSDDEDNDDNDKDQPK